MKQDNFRATLKTCNKCGNKYMIAHQTAECPHPRVVDTPEFKAAFEAKTMSKQDESVVLCPCIKGEFCPMHSKQDELLTPEDEVFVNEITKRCCGAPWGTVHAEVQYTALHFQSKGKAQLAKSHKHSSPTQKAQGACYNSELGGENSEVSPLSLRNRLDRPELREKINTILINAGHKGGINAWGELARKACTDQILAYYPLPKDRPELRILETNPYWNAPNSSLEGVYEAGKEAQLEADRQLLALIPDKLEIEREQAKEFNRIITPLRDRLAELDKKLDDREADLIEAKREERERIKIPINMALTMFDEMLAKSEPKMPCGARAVRTQLEKALKEGK